jgi:hypothetical protein
MRLAVAQPSERRTVKRRCSTDFCTFAAAPPLAQRLSARHPGNALAWRRNSHGCLMQPTLPLVFLPVDPIAEIREKMGPMSGSGAAEGAPDESVITHRTADLDKVRTAVGAAENRPMFSAKHEMLQGGNSEEFGELGTEGTT